MRAVLRKEVGPPESLVLDDVPEPEVSSGEVVIDVHACGFNFPDVLIVEGKYQARPFHAVPRSAVSVSLPPTVRGRKHPQAPGGPPPPEGMRDRGCVLGEFTRREPEASRENDRELLDMYVRGEIEPVVSQTFPMERAAEALSVLANRKALGKVVVTMR